MRDICLKGYLVAVEWRRGWQQYALLAEDEDCAKIFAGELCNTRDEPIEVRRKLLFTEIVDLALKVGELRKVLL